jgi:hypothetical protein
MLAAGRNFESAMDTSQLLPGQTIEIRLTGPVNPGPPVEVTANRVRLRTTQFTAKVKAGPTLSPDFSVDSLPACLPTPASATSTFKRRSTPASRQFQR